MDGHNIEGKRGMKTYPLFILFLAILANATIAEAANWYVKQDGTGAAPTIQAGIDSAATGDTVLLAAGVFTGIGNRDIDFRGKAITVTSESGADLTIVDCEGVSLAFNFESGEGSGSVLSGLTITNGNGADGGGIQVTNGSPVIQNNVLTNCTGGRGGGLYCVGPAAPLILSNTISHNTATIGGGIMVDSGANPTISDNTIGHNSAILGGGIYDASGTTCTISGNHLLSNESTYKGGAIAVTMNSTPEIDSNVIEGNSATASTTTGAGIHCDEGTNAHITNNTIMDNLYSATTGVGCGGGGVGIYRAMATIEGNVFRRNGGDAHDAVGFGGAIQVFESSAVIRGNDFFANTSTWGAAINVSNVGIPGKSVIIENNLFHENFCWQWGAVSVGCVDGVNITNCTFVDNRSGLPGYSGELATYGSVFVTNCIIAFSEAERTITADTLTSFICCNIYGNAAGDGLGGGTDGGGNFSSDPRFCDLPADNFSVAADSPCLPAFNECGVLVGARNVGCGAVPVKKVTWGSLKAILENESGGD